VCWCADRQRLNLNSEPIIPPTFSSSSYVPSFVHSKHFNVIHIRQCGSNSLMHPRNIAIIIKSVRELTKKTVFGKCAIYYYHLTCCIRTGPQHNAPMTREYSSRGRPRKLMGTLGGSFEGMHEHQDENAGHLLQLQHMNLEESGRELPSGFCSYLKQYSIVE